MATWEIVNNAFIYHIINYNSEYKIERSRENVYKQTK